VPTAPHIQSDTLVRYTGKAGTTDDPANR
jgi:hypothetical protein